MRNIILKQAFNIYRLLKKSSDFPRYINIELTNECNVSCIMCPRTKMKRGIGSLQKSTFEKIVKEISHYKNRTIWLHLFGEPLLYPGLFWAIRTIKENCLDSEVCLSTNCLSLDSDKSRELLESGLDRIRLCIDTIDEHKYANTRIGSDFNKVLNNIKTFLALKQKLKKISPIAEIQYLTVKDQRDVKRIFASFWKPFLGKADRIHFQRFSTFANTLNDIEDNFRIRKRGICARLWSEISIYCDGNITACCYDVDAELLIGNVADNGIRQIWDAKAMQDIRKAHLNGDFSRLKLCQKCRLLT